MLSLLDLALKQGGLNTARHCFDLSLGFVSIVFC